MAHPTTTSNQTLTPVAAPSPSASLGRRASLLIREVRVEQTLFALPFAYLTLFLAEDGTPSGSHFAWITLAMLGARSLGMAANRLIDAAADARNVRTAARAIPAGLLRRRDVLVFMALAAGLFLGAVYQLSPWAQRLWPAALALVVLYPYIKRYTWACHLALAMVYVMVPNGVWIAVANELSLGSVLLGLGAGFWAAGFDTIYATQDIDFDRREGVHSIPARFGLARGLAAAKLFHVATVGLLAGAGPALDAGALYYGGVAAFFALLVYEHRLVSPADTSRASVAFFNMNGIISVVFCCFVVADVLTR